MRDRRLARSTEPWTWAGPSSSARSPRPTESNQPAGSPDYVAFCIVGKFELRVEFLASHMGTLTTTPLLRNRTDVRHCSQHAGANVDFGHEGAVQWAFLGVSQQLRALLLG